MLDNKNVKKVDCEFFIFISNNNVAHFFRPTLPMGQYTSSISTVSKKPNCIYCFDTLRIIGYIDYGFIFIR